MPYIRQNDHSPANQLLDAGGPCVARHVDDLGPERGIRAGMREAALALVGQGQSRGGEVNFAATQQLEQPVQGERELDIDLHAQVLRQQLRQRVLEPVGAVAIKVIGGWAVARGDLQYSLRLDPLQGIAAVAAGAEQGREGEGREQSDWQ